MTALSTVSENDSSTNYTYTASTIDKQAAIKTKHLENENVEQSNTCVPILAKIKIYYNMDLDTFHNNTISVSATQQYSW